MKNNYNIKTTFFQTKLIPSQIRPSFLYKNRNLTEIKKSILHIPTAVDPS